MRLKMVLVVILLCIVPADVMAMSEAQHKSETATILNAAHRSKELKGMIVDVHKLIDKKSFEVLDKLNALQDGVALGSKSDHRILFHWGLKGDIPFRSSEKLSAYLGKLTPENQSIARSLIIGEWQNITSTIEEEITQRYMQSNGLRIELKKQAEAIIGIMYDTHILADYTTKKIYSLQNPQKLVKDIVDNLYQIFGQSSEYVRNLEVEINRIMKIIKESTDEERIREAVSQIRELLKKANIGNRLVKLGLLNPESVKLIEEIMNAEPPSRILATIGRMEVLYNRLLDTMPEKLRPAFNMAAVTALISSMKNTWLFCNGELDASEALLNVAQDTILSGSSLYVSEAIIQHLGGGKFALTVLIDKPTDFLGRLQHAKGAALQYAVFTFVFDEATHIWKWVVSEEISTEDFVRETRDTMIKSVVSGTASYCTVLLAGVAATSPWVMAVAIGSSFMVSKALDVYEDYDSRHYFFIEDVIGRLPLEIQRKESVFAGGQNGSIFNLSGKTIFDVKEKKTILDVQRKTIFD